MDQITNRIRQIIDINNLTPSQFADKISINRSRLSHILTGRNFASLDIVQSILGAFPAINPQWLLTGQGEQLRTDNEIFDSTGNSNKANIPDLFSFTPEISENRASVSNEVKPISAEPSIENMEKVKSIINEPVIEKRESFNEEKKVERWEEHGHQRPVIPVKAKIKMIAIYYDNNEYELMYPDSPK